MTAILTTVTRLVLLLVLLVAVASACADAEPPPLDQDQQQAIAEPSDPRGDQVRESANETPQPQQTQTQQQQTQQQSQQAAPQPVDVAQDPPAPAEASLAPPFDFAVAESYLEHIAGVLGPRASATDQERIAAEYMAEVFNELGYEVELQEFDFVNAATFTPIPLPNREPAVGFLFPGASRDAVSGPVVVVPGLGEPADYAGFDVDGAIVIVRRGVIEFRAKAVHAEAAGAAALIIANETAVQSIGGTFGGDTSTISVLHVSTVDGRALRLLDGAELSIPAAAPASGASQNVIARKPGGECRVVVGGHYDTVPGVDGANDNGSGAALTLALAEIWTLHPAALDICFIGFGAEELGLHGSLHLTAIPGWLEPVTAMLNLDAIGDGVRPIQIIASPALRTLTAAVATQQGVDAETGALPRYLGSDHSPFAQAGVPVVFVFPPGAVLHTPADNLDNVNWPLFRDIGMLNHGILACLLERAGADITPPLSCGE